MEPFLETRKIIIFRIIGVVSAGNLHRWWFSCEETAEEPCMVPSPAPLENEVKHVTRQAAIFDPPRRTERKMEKTQRSGRMRICRQGDKKQTDLNGGNKALFFYTVYFNL